MVQKLLTKFKLVPFLLTALTLVTLSFLAGNILAAPQAVPTPKVKCPDINGADPNFNSSRPYQASPCGDSPKAIMCGNSLQVIEDTPSRRAAPGTQFLDVNFEMGNKTYAADVTGASFPIAGNTEQTANSQNASDQIDDATKMNEYLNWYLNGTTDRAEYGNNGLTVDYAGPVKKLLPGAIQDAQRIATIKNLSTSATYNIEQPQNPGQQNVPQATTEPAVTHDQIVVCTNNDKDNNPIPCYNGDGTPAKGKPYRLSSWIGDISILRTISNTILQGLSFIPGINDVVASVASKAWNNKEPPLPWGTNPNTSKQFTPLEYQKAYNEWRGQSCIIAPIINRLVCVDNPLITNQWADLYPYIPLSNTVDKNAHLPITGVGVNGVGGTVVVNSNPQYKINQEPVLYYPHTAETSELSDSLNQTYVPKEGTTSDTQTDTTEPINVPTKDMAAYQNCIAQGNGPLECQGFLNGNKCNIVNVRSNPGDYLFPEVTPSQVNVYVNSYTVTRIPCHDVTTEKTKKTASGEEVVTKEVTYALCQGQVAIEIRMNTKVPYATEIFNSTTAGANSTFRKIYPKVGVGAPVSCVANIPSVTDVQYISTQNLDGMKVIGPLGDNTTDNPKLYFPHFGSVYDYFLKGIQTALRPQGFADPTPESGTLCLSSLAGGDCSFNMGKITQAIQKAATKYNIPAELLKAIFQIESADEIADPSSYQCVENSAKAAGVAQITESAYLAVTCSDERLTNDIGVCSANSGKLSRCNIDDAFELAARVLLWKAGKLNGCSPTSGLSLSNKVEWYNAACNYYGTFAPDTLTVNFANEIPANERRQDGQMNYCDIVCWEMGQCSGSNYPAR